MKQNPKDVEMLQENLEATIRNVQKSMDYNTSEFPLEFYSEKRRQGNLLCYSEQEPTWDNEQRSYFVETVIAGMPFPAVTVALESKANGDDSFDTAEDDSVSVIVVEGYRRLISILEFLRFEQPLVTESLLPGMKGKTFNSLPNTRKRKLNRTSIRTVIMRDTRLMGKLSLVYRSLARGDIL